MAVERVRLSQLLEYGVVRLAIGFVNLLPERLSYGIAGAVGRLYFRLSPRRQRLGMHMLRNAYPHGPSDAELRRIACVATGNVFKIGVDTVRVIPLLAKGTLLERVDMTEAKKVMLPPPFIGVSAHLGSWELGAMVFSQIHGEAHVIARTFRNPLLQRFIAGSRQKAGLHIHPKRGGVRGLARALRGGAIGLQVADQHQRLRGIVVPFFGEPASTDRSAASLALRAGLPIVVGSLIRIGPGMRFRLLLDPPFHPRGSRNHRQDVIATTLEVNRRLERHILAWPEQYLWIHDRYRRKPDEQEP